jgi:hypothetical protein
VENSEAEMANHGSAVDDDARLPVSSPTKMHHAPLVFAGSGAQRARRWGRGAADCNRRQRRLNLGVAGRCSEFRRMRPGDREAGIDGLSLGGAVGSDAGQPTRRLGRGGQIDLG